MDKILLFIKENTLIIVLVAALLIAVELFVYLNYRKRKYNEYMEIVTDLDKQKVRVIYTPIELELSKLNKVVKNVELLVILNEWNEKWKKIKTEEVGKISDEIFSIEDSVENKRFKDLDRRVEECKKHINDLKEEANKLHTEIIELSSIEDKIREKVTNLKAEFRNVKKTFVDNEALLYYVKEELEEKLNQIVEHIHQLDKTVSANEYREAEEMIESIIQEIDVLRVLVEKLPDLVMIVKQYIPRKIVAFEGMYKKCLDNEVYLDHLTFETKVKEVYEMIEVIVEKMRKLSFEDVEAEIEAINLYTDNLYQTLENETNNFYIFNDKYKELSDVIEDSLSYVTALEIEMEKVKSLYEINDFDEDETAKYRELVNKIAEEFKLLAQIPKEEETFFELIEELNTLKVKAAAVVENIEESTSKIMSLRADEQRAREQIVEIQYLVDQSRKMMKKAKLPVVPGNYRVYVADAKDGIKYICDELDNVPIVVETLNKRVDTSLELAYKLYDHTKKIIKESMLSEVAIIYGNRYRSSIPVVDKEIDKAEQLYYKGSYHEALNVVVNILEKTEPGIYAQLKKYFEKGEQINE